MKTASSLVENPTLQRRLAERARVWGDAALRMQALASAVGATVPEQLGAAAVLRRARMSVQSGVNDERAIVEECDRRESAAYREFEVSLERNCAPDVRRNLQATYERLAKLDRLA